MVTKRNRLQYIRQFVIEKVADHPSDLGSMLAQEFAISRQAANNHLRRFVEDGLLDSTGNTRAKKYSLTVLAFHAVEIEVNTDLEEHIVWMDQIVPSLGAVPVNVEDICQYGFTEMVNNVVEHSESPNVELKIHRTAAEITLYVRDYGVGIFNKIQTEYGYRDTRDALLQLSKGKLTTSQEAHSGEGIFFTSRMFDTFLISSGALSFSRVKSIAEEDWLYEREAIEPIQGTLIIMAIDLATSRTTKEVFGTAVTEFEEFAFTRTHVPIKLAKYGHEQLVSRSQAKRVLARFDSFKEAMLDFQGVETIGPAFADEIFRVFPIQHPETLLVWMNTTPAIDQMISRVQSAGST